MKSVLLPELHFRTCRFRYEVQAQIRDKILKTALDCKSLINCFEINGIIAKLSNNAVTSYCNHLYFSGRQVEREIDYYNLDVIISVGYRVKSQRGVQFRIWATNILKEYIKKGFAVDDDRLKELGGGGYFKGLLEQH